MNNNYKGYFILCICNVRESHHIIGQHLKFLCKSLEILKNFANRYGKNDCNGACQQFPTFPHYSIFHKQLL